jgi:hypothetical protein
MGDTVAHIYQRLADVNEIRLLHLLPGVGEDLIVCQMLHSRFLDKVHYEALSYMWGTQDSPQCIRLNGTVVEVRNNLWQALKHIRHTDTVRIIWVDALCINQHDINERNHQVAQMGRVYESATGVMAWLGLSTDSSDIATRYLSKMAPNFRELGETDKDEWPRGHKTPLPDRHEIVALSSFCNREYWSRLWIIQELVVASKITLYCGIWTCSWPIFTAALRLAEEDEVLNGRRHSTEREAAFLSLMQSLPIKLERERNYRQSNSPRPLLQLCIQYESSRCEDRLDKVFGLQAFTLPCCKEAVRIDYASAPSEISRRLLDHHIVVHYHQWRGSELQYAQRLQEVLQITENDLVDQTWAVKLEVSGRLLPHTQYDGLICLSPRILDRITYVSDSLGAWRNQKVKTPITNGPKILQPHIRDCFHSKRRFYSWKSHVRHVYKSSVVPSLHNGDSEVPQPSGHELPNRGVASRAREISMPLRRGFRAHGSVALFEQVLGIASLHVLGSEMSACRLAVDESGRVYFVPSATEVFDLVCYLEGKAGSSILMITRKENSSRPSYQLLGRGVNLFDTLLTHTSLTGHESVPCICSKTTKVGQFADITVSLSLSTIQRLTTPIGPPIVSKTHIVE